MKLFSHLIALLAVLNSLACKRIVKHYHYYYSRPDFPASGEIDAFAALNEFMFVKNQYLKPDERDTLVKIRDSLIGDSKNLKSLTTIANLGNLAYTLGLPCENLLRLMNRVSSIERSYDPVRDCERSKEEAEYAANDSDRRLRSHVELESGA